MVVIKINGGTNINNQTDLPPYRKIDNFIFDSYLIIEFNHNTLCLKWNKCGNIQRNKILIPISGVFRHNKPQNVLL